MKITLDISFKNNDTTVNQRFLTSSQVGMHAHTEKKSQHQILVLDGIRAIACLIVLSYHINLLAHDYGILSPLPKTNILTGMLAYFDAFFAQFGESGVILFFVLSGFLLFLPYAKALLFAGPWPSSRRYYLRRIFRILPGYYATLFLLILFFHPEFLNTNHWRDLWAFVIFNMSLNLSSQVNLPFWTLAVEFQFYLLLPIFVLLFSLIVSGDTLGRRIRRLCIGLLLLEVWGVLTRCWGLYMVNSQWDFFLPHAVSAAVKPFIYGDTGKYFDVFVIGMFIAMVYTCIQNTSSTAYWNARIRQSNWLILVAGLAILVFLPLQHMAPLGGGVHDITLNFADPHMPLLVVDWMQWQVIGYSVGYACCLLALLSGSARLKRPFESPLLRWLGSISFSLYMWHFPFLLLFIYAAVHNIHHQNWNPLVAYGLFWCWTLVVIVPISVAFYRWIEKPGVRLGERLIAASQAWAIRFSVATVQAQAALAASWHKEEPRGYTNKQSRGQLLVKEVQGSVAQTPGQTQALCRAKRPLLHYTVKGHKLRAIKLEKPHSVP